MSNGPQRDFYRSKAWRSTEAAYMASVNYVCERCGRPAEIVHHRRYITPENVGDVHVTLDWKNLEALCMDCHNREHFGSPSCAEGLTFDHDGRLIRN